MTSVLRELDRCVFCGGPEMTEEHLIADWAYRAFARSRKPIGRGAVGVQDCVPVTAREDVADAAQAAVVLQCRRPGSITW